VEEQTKDLQDYLAVIKNRKTGILVIAVSVMFISTLVALLLPPKYKSSATILIEQQEIPQDLAMSTVTSYASERIQVIQARVMSRTNLMEIVNKYGLYADVRKYETTEEIIARMQKNVGMDIISADVVDPRTGRPSSATIAFSLSYQGESPSTVQKVTNELTSLYLNENLKSRTQKAEDTSAFFKQEAERLTKLIAELGQKLAVFKQENADMLPELQGLNQQILQRKETDISNIEARMNVLEENRFYLSGQIAQIDPGNSSVPSAAERLMLLEAQYASAKARYSDDHPDVQRLKREMDSLKSETGGADSSSALAEAIVKLRAQLSDAKQKYSPDHPDVIALEGKLSALNDELKQLQSRPETKHFQSQPENPAYITLQAQLAAIENEMKSALQQKNKLNADIEKLEKNMQKAPQVEREYRSLTRDYENAVAQFQDNKAKQSRADVGKQLESESKGERFTLIDPAALPEEPISPNRPAILFLGFVFSLGSGIGFAFVADAISGAIHGAKNIQISLGMVPLAVIPYQMNMADMQKRKKLQKRTVLVGFAAIVIGVLLIHFLISPLDVLWFRLLRKFEIFTS
jgi:uncharacterized protein involved in exopolysaccharide biosynthesis